MLSLFCYKISNTDLRFKNMNRLCLLGFLPLRKLYKLHLRRILRPEQGRYRDTLKAESLYV